MKQFGISQVLSVPFSNLSFFASVSSHILFSQQVELIAIFLFFLLAECEDGLSDYIANLSSVLLASLVVAADSGILF
jgi:hypothetical protein